MRNITGKFCNLDDMTFFTPVTAVNYVKKLSCLIFLIGFFGTVSAKEHQFLVLNYHDIVGAEGAKPPFNAMDVSIDHFEEHLLWLKKNGYLIISIQNILDAAAGKVELPVKVRC